MRHQIAVLVMSVMTAGDIDYTGNTMAGDDGDVADETGDDAPGFGPIAAALALVAYRDS